jgi:hypothetical protein
LANSGNIMAKLIVETLQIFLRRHCRALMHNHKGRAEYFHRWRGDGSSYCFS